MMTERVLPLQGVHNFRDCGGYAVSGGGRLRRGVLWRSGQHHGATDADLAAIAGLGLDSVFDLRSSKERASHPCRRPQGFGAEVFLCGDSERVHAPHVAAAHVRPQRTPESMRENLLRAYTGIAFRPELQAMMRGWFARLSKDGGPSLIHCMAGKDRTGIAVAMLHLVAGVHRDDVMEDYLLTNTAGDSEARITSGAETITVVSGPLEEDVVRVLMGVEPEYLETAFAAVEARHGTVDGYLEEALGAGPATRERIRGVLLEG
ncbi:tyrosine-protein phosphatase [Novosphingobium album (ex Hu et al. 2023)]|uniref:Tyrosine-protein phosphatase n=1 Tax=Novosphingobium album (ex Hu et al. 2023) TaxID=2930093 RepID=A0ABT0AY16_9SPHN|nr:tyrosine-protein phosphatase [Novosphingobium album (ex Hu et al. 2023)]MCJ2177677.1 tyrosine-protein phosphatase [Novosphingobium album (ex Hu et al. 2023)]